LPKCMRPRYAAQRSIKLSVNGLHRSPDFRTASEGSNPRPPATNPTLCHIRYRCNGTGHCK
jgi:hypothetical protein